MYSIQNNISNIRQRIIDAEQHAGRAPHSVKLLAASKTQSTSSILDAVQAGIDCFGENYAQEGCRKIQDIRQHTPELTCEWHFIGPLQSNKTRPIAQYFDWVHSVDRYSIAQRLSQHRTEQQLLLNICIQVNLSHETNKSGCHLADVIPLALKINQLPYLRLRGLMTLPEATADPTQLRLRFASLRHCLMDLQDKGLAVDTLSMGMSADLELAIEEGSTLVRVGTGIFGER